MGENATHPEFQLASPHLSSRGWLLKCFTYNTKKKKRRKAIFHSMEIGSPFTKKALSFKVIWNYSVKP